MSGKRPLLRRERLLRVVGRRFGVRLMVVRAGAGFGKSTVLRQAMAENSLDPAGIDVYVPMPAQQTPGLDLATLVLPRLTGSGSTQDGATMQQVADAVWAKAPNEVAIIIDDLHRLQDQAQIAADLRVLVESLPSNGHVVVASRRTPPIPFQAMVARAEAIVLDEDELRFDDEELASFASLRGSDTAGLGGDGWPALVELRATAGSSADREFVAEEVLTAIGDDQLEALRRLVLHGRFDDDLVTRCTSYSGQAADLAAQLPLTSHDGDSYLLHDLWPTMLPPLPPGEEAKVCAELAAALELRDDLASAVGLFVQAERWADVQRLLLRLAQDFAASYGLAERRQVLAALPDSLADTAAAQVIAADLKFLPAPATARHALQGAAQAAVEEHNGELEALAVFRLAELAFRAADTDELGRHIERLVELAGDGSSAITSLARLARVWECMSTDRLEEALVFLSIEASDHAPTRAYEDFYRVALLSHSGHASATIEGKTEVVSRLPGRLAARGAGARFIALFQSGRMTADDLLVVTELVQRIGASGDSQLHVEAACTSVLFHLVNGEVSVADELLADAERAAVIREPGDWSEHLLAVARSARRLVDHDEEAAGRILEKAIPAGGPRAGLSPHIYLNVMSLAYFTVPRTREFFERIDFGPEGQRSLAIARALIALRDNGNPGPAAQLDWTRPELIRPWAFEPHLAELAVAALSEGVAEAEAVIDELRHDPYVALSAVAERSSGKVAATAQKLLKTTPRRPAELTFVGALGPLVVSVGTQSQEDAALRRRVVELLALLVLNDQMSRAEICLAIWPDFDEKKARNNLGVTLTHLRRLLEPTADRKAESWHIATVGESIALVRSEHLRIDCDDFNAALASARRADAAGLPGSALEEYLRATALYRADLFPELLGSEIGSLDRTRFRLDFVAAATRAASLLTASGRQNEAVELSRRAVEAESLADGAHASLIRALDAAGLPAEAARAACRTIFADAGLPLTRDLELLVAGAGT